MAADLALPAKYYSKYISDKAKKRTPREAYFKVVRRFHEAFFVNYDFPKVRNITSSKQVTCK